MAPSSGNIETYLITDTVLGDRHLQLTTIASWQGTSSTTRKFTATKVPCVINYGYKPTSQIYSDVTVYAWKDNQSRPASPSSDFSVYYIPLEEEGTYTIEVDAVGAQWWLKIGVEQ